MNTLEPLRYDHWEYVDLGIMVLSKTSYDELLNYIESLNKKILIVIDDIDRLNNNEIQQIFQLVKMLGNFPNTIYLLSMDDTIVANSLKEVQKYDGYKYLEKIVQVPLRLPLSKKEDIFNYLLNFRR